MISDKALHDALRDALDGLTADERYELQARFPSRRIDDIITDVLCEHARLRARARPGVERGVGRRALLKGLGASALLAPFATGALLPLSAGRANARAATAPDNLLLISWPCGMEPGWTPMGTGQGYTLANTGPGSGPKATEALLTTVVEKHRNRVAILSGMEGLIGTDLYSHSEGPASIWTGWIRAAPTRGMAGAASIDQLIREKIGAQSPHKSIHAGVLVNLRETGSQSTISLPYYHWAGPQTPIEATDDPGKLYRDLAPSFAARGMSSMAAGTPASDAAVMDALALKRQSVLDYVGSEIKDVQAELGSADRIKLERHLDHVRGLEQQLFGGSAAANAGTCRTPGEPASMLTGAGALLPANGEALVKTQAELIGLAFQCGLTKVATLQIGESDCMWTIPYDEAGSPMHLASHDMGQGGQLDTITRWVSTRYMMDRVSDILDVLAGIEVSEGESLLDHTLVVATSEMSLHRHFDKNMPYVISGGKGGTYAIPGGRHLALPESYRISKLLVSILEYYGIPDQTFGNYTGDGDFTGSIPELKG